MGFLIRALRDKRVGIRLKAVEALRVVGININKEQAVRALLEALNDKNPDVRIDAAGALVQLGEPVEWEIIASTLMEKFAVELIDEDSLGTIIVRPRVLLEALEDWDFRVRFRAVEDLWRFGLTEPAVQALSKELLNENSQVRELAIKLVGRLGIKEEHIAWTLQEALKDKDIRIRVSAAEALTQLGIIEPAVLAMLEALRDESAENRVAVVEALGRLGINEERVIQALIEALKDENILVQLSAAEALKRLGVEVSGK